MVGAGIALLIPALVHGVYLGPYDILSTNGLTAQHGAIVHNSSLRDQIALFIPFTEQVWTQVHQGHLPLWNPDSGLGMPLAFNWESAPFGLPALVGYLFPMRFAYTVGIIVTVVVAGTGGYVFGRVLRLGVIASAFVGTVFVLCGSMVSLLGWSATSVGSWAGWLFATAVLVIRGRHRARSVAAFVLVIAMTLYAGHPETALLVFLSLAVFIVVVLACRVPRLGAPGPIRRPAFDIILAGVAGAGLAAPLLLPGMQLISQSGRSGSGELRRSDDTRPWHPAIDLPRLRRAAHCREPLVRIAVVPMDGRVRRGHRARNGDRRSGRTVEEAGGPRRDRCRRPDVDPRPGPGCSLPCERAPAGRRGDPRRVR